ncbi:MAG: sigma-70 family RNA polymerase sigma factor [Methylophilus sp.]
MERYLPLIDLDVCIQGMIDRDEQSLNQFYDLTITKVYGLALKITRKHDLAEETVVDTYMQAWLEVAKLNHKRGSPMAWLMMICRSRAIDILRTVKSEDSYDELTETLNDRSNHHSSLDILLVIESDSEVKTAISGLNPLQRQLISLVFFKGYTHEQIAAQMDMPLGTIKTNIRRAQTKLMNILSCEGNTL